MSSSNETSLAAPGAGLPLPELFVARLLFAFRRATGNVDSFTRNFQRERAAIRRLVDGCDEELLAKRVLIRRLPGMEDSSRNWSLLMTLDHLRIVHLAFTRVIEALGNGTLPEGKASTADVKPAPEVSAAVIANYESSCDGLLQAVAAVPNMRTGMRFAHPWFGPLDAYSWHALSGVHMGIHRKQIERILDGLASSSAA